MYGHAFGEETLKSCFAQDEEVFAVKGRFRVYAKYRATPMRGPGYYLPNVPWTMYFYGGYAIHGTYWHNNFGTPMSHGCVNMKIPEAKWLYNWTPRGTLVVVHQ